MDLLSIFSQDPRPYGVFFIADGGIHDASGILMTEEDYELLKERIQSGLVSDDAVVWVYRYDEKTNEIEKEYLLK